MPKKGTSKAAGTLSDKEIETLKKANKASHSASAEKKRKATLAATNAIKNTLGFSGRLTPIVQDYLRDILMEKDGSGKTYLQNYLLTFLNEAKTNPNSHASAMLAQAVFSNDLFTRLDDEINRQMAKDIQFQEFRIRQTLYNKQQEVFDCKDKLIECMCSRRVGKTELAGRLLAKRVVRPNQHCVYINRSFDAAARQINKPLMDALAQTDLHWTGTCSGGKLEFENGSWILILGNHNIADIDKIRGEKVALCILDESGHMKNMKQLMQEVISPAMMDYEDSQLFMIGTPPRVPNTYAQEMWNNASVTHFHWTYLDNPFLPNRENVLDEVCKLYSVAPDSPFIKREFQGDMSAYDYEAMPFHNNIKYDKLPEGPYDRAYIGVDYGYGDEAAVVSLVVKDKKMYITDCWAQSKKTVTELCDEIQRQLDNLKKLPLANTQPQIICDTNEGAITAELYYQRHMPNVATAYKYDKYYALCMLSEWLRNGTILTPQDSYINYEAEHTVWKRDPETDKMENELDDDVFHPNALMAVLYVSRQFAYEVLGLTTENKTAKSIIGE